MHAVLVHMRPRGQCPCFVSASWSKICSNTGPTIARASVTPPVDPGALTMRAAAESREVIPTKPRESPAVGDVRAPRSLICSANPPRRATSNGAVASGVRSRGEIPVPPVVKTNRHPSFKAQSRASRTDSTPSGTTATGSKLSQWYPNSVSIETARGPDWSITSPAVHRSETVMMRALIFSTLRCYRRCIHPCLARNPAPSTMAIFTPLQADQITVVQPSPANRHFST